MIDSFSDRVKKDYKFQESSCFLKTKTNTYKKHYAVLLGNELYCYRNKNDKVHRLMHCLVGTFIKELEEEKNQEEGTVLYPLKIFIPPNKSRVIYYKTKEQQ